MEVIRCNKGHFYDSEEYSTCPYCSGAAGGKSRMPEDIVPTDCFVHSGPVADLIPPTAPANTGSASRPTEPVDGRPKGQKYPLTKMTDVQLSGKTTWIDSGMPSGGKADLVGWLVCVEGPSRGKDYHIRNQNNYIGRSANSDISIPDDSTISMDHSANIVYNYKNRSFFFSPMMGKNPVWVNEELVVNTVQLQAYDVLQVGVTKLMFVPLCSDRFDWNEK